ncbi:TraR/DksA family transcriptional regulator [Allofranklinella schreckenbergeri]|uniref:TraR/DksA family transcriptional regulator n=1 Tax=Allofranklinella schreckenbergeri TaxID=1076744 RepID=A0A3M6QWS4_9BURK|nr:TraR/DksA C4-type zinc finger protein [Allofranklinella schreckenbergeri]RMX07433.1 TraR/DksA family transcriptional regulator [Allofranklinella schreckenbergeri]
MTDTIERAQERGQEWLHDQLARQALVAQRSQRQIALRECEDCGEPIPQARRQALPGVRRCVGCQEQYEQQQRR